MTEEEFAALPENLDVRVVRYSIAHKGFRTQSVTLVTTLTDATIPAEDLAALYGTRGQCSFSFIYRFGLLVSSAGVASSRDVF
jgi:hypothetical protein